MRRSQRIPNNSRDRAVLIVDDDRVTADLLAGRFRAAGWRVAVTGRYDDALAKAAVSPPTHAIVEQRLADGSGLELMRRLDALHPGLLAVMLTRYPSVAGAVQAIRAGFRDYLPKPVNWLPLAELFDLPAPAADHDGDDESDGPPSLARAEWEHIHAALFQCGGNVSAAARRLGVHRRSLQRKLQRIAPRWR